MSTPTLQDQTSYVFGNGIERLDPNTLPTELNVLRNYVYLFDASCAEKPRMVRKKRIAAVTRIVSNSLIDVWRGKSRDVRTEIAVYSLVRRLVEVVDVVKVRKANHETNLEFINDVINKHNKLCDISKKPDEVVADDPMDIDIDVGESEVAVEIDAGHSDVAVESDAGPSTGAENIRKKKRKRKSVVPPRFRNEEVVVLK